MDNNKNNNIIKVASVFSGIGSFEHSLLKNDIKYEIVFACDIDKNCKKNYMCNYKIKQSQWYNDINEIDGNKYKNELDLKDKVYKANETADCPNGTRGRMAVIEVFDMTDELEAIILSNPSEAEITRIVRSQGMLTMKEDAIIKSMHQEVPFEDVNML